MNEFVFDVTHEQAKLAGVRYTLCATKCHTALDRLMEYWIKDDNPAIPGLIITIREVRKHRCTMEPERNGWDHELYFSQHNINGQLDKIEFRQMCKKCHRRERTRVLTVADMNIRHDFLAAMPELRDDEASELRILKKLLKKEANQ